MRGFGSARSLVDSEKVNENRVDVDWKIITEKPSKGEAWIWKRSQPLLTRKKSTKIELMPIGKSSSKHLPKATWQIGSACSPCWLRKSQWNKFQRWCVDLLAPTAMFTQKKSVVLQVTPGFVRAHNPFDSKKVNDNWVAVASAIVNETASTGDAWIHQRLQTLLTQKQSMKQLPKVTRGFRNHHLLK